MTKNTLQKYTWILILAMFLPLVSLPAEETADGGFAFGLGLNLGVETFPDPAGGDDITYQKIGFVPDFSFGKFGISMDLSFHIATATGAGDSFSVRKEDWVPAGDPDFGDYLQLYLSKFNYVRYGMKGDPLFVKLGNIDDGTLGTGFIMSNYNNTLFQPEEKLFGMMVDLDGKLFNFPYVGMESFVGNVAHPDVMGMRLFGRPLAWSTLPIIQHMEVGITVAGDRDPAFREDYFTALTIFDAGGDGNLDFAIDPVYIWGLDVIQPILANPLVSLAGFASFAVEPNGASGAMLGFGGRLISFIPYVFQLRFLGDSFIPSYFDATYDIYRAQKYAVMNGDITFDPFVGWFFSSGFSLLEDQIVFTAGLDGPFSPIPAGTTDGHSSAEYPHMRLTFRIEQGLLPGFFFDAYYDKQYITGFKEAFDPDGAVIGANINYQTGPAIITLAYDFVYDPITGDYTTTAKLVTSIGLF